MGMTELHDRLAQEREEIATRVANWTQQNSNASARNIL
jgi:hypothetical protein